MVGNEYYCDCKIGIKGDICKHVMALMYDRENFAIDPRLRSVKLGRKKRGVGRPSKVGPALSKSPPRNMVDIESFTETGEEDILLHDWTLPPPRTNPCSISPLPPPPPPSFSPLLTPLRESAPTSISIQPEPAELTADHVTKPSKKAQSYILCKNCGKVVNKKSMSAHLRSKPCQNKKDVLSR